MSGPFAQALHDFHFCEQRGPLRYRDGEETETHPIDGYFAEYAPDDWLPSRLDGPLLDMGAGAGRHALYFQEQFGTTAIEPRDLLVETMRDRGVDDARSVDMFALRDAFDSDVFRSVLSVGTQVGIAKLTSGLRRFLDDLAYVTTPDATAVLDGYKPGHETTKTLPGYRVDPANDHAYRIVQYEYDGKLGTPWLFQLFAPSQVCDAATDTNWEVTDVRHGDGDWAHTYNVALTKH